MKLSQICLELTKFEDKIAQWDGVSMFLWNTANQLPDYMVFKPKDHSMHLQQCENLIYHCARLLFYSVSHCFYKSYHLYTIKNDVKTAV